MATITQNPPTNSKAAASPIVTYQGDAPIARDHLVQAMHGVLHPRRMGQIKVFSLDFSLSKTAPCTCIVKVAVPGAERSRFYANFGGIFFATATTPRGLRHAAIHYYFLEF
nr:hypothetical protein [Candidatus Sigynarchaeota archaeon]